MAERIFRIGTRSSPLAMKQAQMLQAALQAAHVDLVVELVPVQSAADWKKSDGEKPLSEENGGKGLFAKEIEQAILDGRVDCGVHSLKDMASFLPEGLVIEHVLKREDPRDAFICKQYKSLDELPSGAVIGTCSTRRAAIALHCRPDLKIVPFRGNVQTRLDKIESGQVDATFLAMAGLNRLGIESTSANVIDTDVMLPACGQGAICMEIRKNDDHSRQILGVVHCTHTGLCVAAEREVLAGLDGSCHTPISAYAVIENDELWLRVQVYSLDGQVVFAEDERVKGELSLSLVQQCGADIAQKLKARLPEGFLE